MVILSTIMAYNIQRRSHRNKGDPSNLKCFAFGAIGRFIGQEIPPKNPLQAVQKCIPAEWGGSQGKDEDGGVSYVQDGNSIVKKILNWEFKAGCVMGHCAVRYSTDQIVKKICEYATKVIDALGGRRFRRRMFLQSSARNQRFMIYKALNKVWKTNNKLSKNKRGVWDYIKSAVSDLVKPVLTKFKDWVIGLIEKIPIVKKIIDTFNCLKTLALNVINTIKKRVAGLVTAIKKLLTGWKGFVSVIIKTICQWKTFKQAIIDLIDAFKNKGCDKWYLIGKAVGGLIAAIADSS